MKNITGTVKNVNVDHEGNTVILRFKVQLDNTNQIPVEMRGHRLLGVLENGDQVMINIGRKKDKYGIIRPYQIENLTTNSIVRVTSIGIFSKLFNFSVSIIVSIVGGAITKVAMDLIFIKKKIPRGGPIAPHRAPQTTTGDPIPIFIGMFVGLVIFYFIYLRRRRE